MRYKAGDQLEQLQIFARWAEIDPIGALSEASAWGAAGMGARLEVLRVWGEIDPEAAAAHLAAHPLLFSKDLKLPGLKQTEREAAFATVAREWGELDPAKALQWAQSVGQELAVVEGCVARDPQAAIALMKSLPVGMAQPALEVIAREWAVQSPDAAATWAKTLDGPSKDRALVRITDVVSQDQPELAATLVGTITDESQRSRATATLMGNWAAKSPEDALAWLTANTPESAQGTAITGWVATITKQDPARGLSTVEMLPAGSPLRDRAVASYIEHSESVAYDDLLAVAGTIRSETERGQSLAVILTRWKEQDPAAATAYIREHLGEDL